MAALIHGKLGRRPTRHDPRTLKLAKYLRPELPPPPESVDWTHVVQSWPMALNDSLGDCTIAAAQHLIQLWTAQAKGSAQVVSDGDVLKAYEAVSGYVAGDESTDNGADELTVLTYWRKTGIGGHQISAFVEVDPSNTDHVKSACALFGGVYLGLALPKSAQGQDAWDVSPSGIIGDGAPGSWGGHAVPVVAYDATGLTVVTWSQLLRMTWAFFAAYCEEAYAILSPDWIEAGGQTPAGFDLNALQLDLGALAEGA